MVSSGTGARYDTRGKREERHDGFKKTAWSVFERME